MCFRLGRNFVGAVFVGCIAVILVGPANAGDVMLVPEDYTTIQEAVDAANPAGGDTVLVGPGDFAGAVITNPVRIIGSGNDTRITSGTYFYPDDAFDLIGIHFNVDGTEIRNLVIEFEGLGYGVYGYSANDVTVANVTIVYPVWFGVLAVLGEDWKVLGNTIYDAFRAIDIRYSDNCEVMHNKIEGLTVPGDSGAFHVDGIFLGVTNSCVVAHNYVHHVGTVTGNYTELGFIGIGLASVDGLPTEGNNFHHNQSEISVPGVDWSLGGVFVDYGAQAGLPVALQNNQAMHNDFCGSSTGFSFNPEELKNYNKVKLNRCPE